MSDHCPKCGAESSGVWEDSNGDEWVVYSCDTDVSYMGTAIEGKTCLRNQLSQRDKELSQVHRRALDYIAELEGKIAAARIAFEYYAHRGQEEDYRAVCDALHDAKRKEAGDE